MPNSASPYRQWYADPRSFTGDGRAVSNGDLLWTSSGRSATSHPGSLIAAGSCDIHSSGFTLHLGLDAVFSNFTTARYAFCPIPTIKKPFLVISNKSAR